MSYTPIHLHTHFSLLDGCIKIPELVDRLVELKIPACAITDHGVLSGIIDFYKECRKKNIKYILGCESYLTNDPDDSENRDRRNYHMVLLCKNKTGLENLIWLTTQANLHNFYYKPRIWIEHFKEHSEGLIACSACLGGIASKQLRYEHSISKVFVDDYSDFLYKMSWFREVFRGEFYLEIQDHDFWEQKEFNDFIIDFARKEKFPLIITSDAHYLKKEDSYLHEMMMAMQFKQTLEQYRAGDNMKYGGTNYVKSYEEMYAAAKKWNAIDALENTVAIAEKCEDIDLGLNSQYFMPTFDVKSANDYNDFQKYLKEKNNGYIC